MSSPRVRDTKDPFGSRSLSRYHKLIILLCALCVIIDGADFQIMGFVAPAIIRDWHIRPEEMTGVFTSGIVGLMIGSILLAPLADRIGRKPTLIAAMLIFAFCMMCTVLTKMPAELMIVRLVTGIGLGSVMPNACALAGEYSPIDRRVTILVSISTCFAVGAVLGGLVAAALIPAYGWHSVFYAGAVAPLALAGVLIAFMPESVEFLRVRGDLDQASAIRRRLGPVASTATTTMPNSAGLPPSPSLRRLFSDGRSAATLFLWATNLLNLTILMFLSSWLPTVMIAAGRAPSQSIFAGTVLQIGGVFGGFTLASLTQRFGFRNVLIWNFAAAAASLALVGQEYWLAITQFGIVAVCGFTIVGGQQALNGWASNHYPTELRSTGSGWAIGVGRLGSILGPILGGWLIATHVSLATLFECAAVPALLLSVLVYLIRLNDRGPAPIDVRALPAAL